MSGSSLHIDADTINALLKALADRPGGPTFAFVDGRIVVRHVGGSSVTFVVDHVSLSASGLDVGLSVSF